MDRGLEVVSADDFDEASKYVARLEFERERAWLRFALIKTHQEFLDSLDDLLIQNHEYRKALEMIAFNTCCDSCREAALVARKGLGT